MRPPFTLGLEFAGVVLRAPPSSPFQPGARVFGSALGSYAEEVCAPPSALRPLPPGWTFADAAGQAATLPVAYGALVARGGLARGETVLEPRRIYRTALRVMSVGRILIAAMVPGVRLVSAPSPRPQLDLCVQGARSRSLTVARSSSRTP